MTHAIPDEAQRLLDPFLRELDRVLDGRVAVILHGSAARGTFLPGTSDVNLLLILDDAAPATLRALAGPFDAWRKAGQPPPLLLSREEWRRSADAFPLEVTDIRGGYHVLRGADLVAEARVSRPQLRAALERELRGKLLQLRRGYVALSGDGVALTYLAQSSSGSLLVLLRALLTLAGESAPDPDADAVERAAAVARFAAADVRAFSDRRGDRNLRATREQFERYLAAVETAAAFVDRLSVETDA